MVPSEGASKRAQWNIVITPTALVMLESIRDVRVRQILIDAIDGLVVSPELKGKPLRGEFAGCRSLRAAGQRYRIIYRLDEEQIIVLILAVGIRREGDRTDIYRLAQRLMRLGLLDPPQEEETDDQKPEDEFPEDNSSEDKSEVK